MLSLLHAPTGFSAPALRPTVAPAAVSMRVSEALPFLEAPPQLDGSMAGDIVSNQQRNPTLIFFRASGDTPPLALRGVSLV